MSKIKHTSSSEGVRKSGKSGKRRGRLSLWGALQKLLPQVSKTERQALEAGAPWVDQELFSGKPNFKKMLREAYGCLTLEEQAFVDGPLQELCRIIDRYQAATTHRVPDHVLDFIKAEGFMGLLIPKEYGGKGFSRLAISTVLHTLSPYSFTVGAIVMIPNSLGAAELIDVYGTDAQKEEYLPKLAAGDWIPCFGLTEPTAGSDAASMKAEGVVFMDEDGELKIRLNFEKRYITLAPIADLCTIACNLSDPDNLLGKTGGDGDNLGITCVLIHKGTPGFKSGEHHLPIGEPFENGTLIGKDVVVPVENIIGGPDGAGLGWKMLMEQLAGGRAVSLPAGAVGNMKVATAATGAYSMVRSQFGRPIGRMEGVEEQIAFIAAMTYMCEAARIWVCSAVDRGIQPPVTSAVLKAYTTELARDVVTKGMNVMAGAGVMQGPNNILGPAYMSAPVGITVEGANILTRTLIIFGQGATRCHQYALELLHAIEDKKAGALLKNLIGWVLHFVAGRFRTFVRSVTRGRTVRVPDVAPDTKKYYRRLGWAAARFGYLSDLALFAMGPKLKAKGKLSGRYADALAYMLLASSALRRFEAEGRREEDRPLLDFAVEHALAQVQVAFEGIYANFDVPVLGFLMRTVGAFWLRVNRLAHEPSDELSHRAAKTVQSYSDQFARLTEGVFVPAEDGPGLGRLMVAFRLTTEAHDAAICVVRAQRAGKLSRGLPDEIADQAVAQRLITRAQADLLVAAQEARLQAIEVDVFSHEQYYK